MGVGKKLLRAKRHSQAVKRRGDKRNKKMGSMNKHLNRIKNKQKKIKGA